MDVLVTGGSGFIGRNIVEMLKDRGFTVTTLDVAEKNSISDIHVKGDVRDIETVRKAVRGKDYVLHLAAVTSPPEFEDFSGKAYEVN
ncbi:MAG: NAD-dependent epimerase/dehydratase family protein, partial [Thermoplasmatales archaeon]